VGWKVVPFYGSCDGFVPDKVLFYIRRKEEDPIASLTPITYIGASADGAEMTTFLAPPFKWAEAFSVVVPTALAAPVLDGMMF